MLGQAAACLCRIYGEAFFVYKHVAREKTTGGNDRAVCGPPRRNRKKVRTQFYFTLAFPKDMLLGLIIKSACCFVQVPESRQDMLADFLSALFKLYIDLNFVYMEINPIVVVEGRITPLDMAAKIDETASFLCGPKWGEIDFPAPFGETAVHDCL